MMQIPSSARINAHDASSCHQPTAGTVLQKKQIIYAIAPAPGSTAAWSELAARGRLGDYRDGDVLLAYDGHRGIDDDLASKLRRHLNDRYQTLLAKRLANRRYGRGSDLWKTREIEIGAAIDWPQSDGGIIIRKSFFNFVDFGTVDAISEDLKNEHQHEPLDDNTPSRIDARAARDDLMHALRLIIRWADGDRRKADVTLMRAMGFTRDEITTRVGVSDVTQREWEAQFAAYRQQNDQD